MTNVSNRMKASKSSSAVLWLQVWGLAAVQGAITFSWVVYALYLPKLLGQLGFPATLAAGLLIVENLLGTVMEPLMGGLSDRNYRRTITRFPFISVGVILSSALFIAIPAVAIFSNPVGTVRWVFIGVVIAWALAMTVFRSPAMALLGRYAAPAELPLAASLITVFGGVVGSFRSIADKFMLSFPPAVVFAIGSFVLLGATAVVRYVNPPNIPTLEEDQPHQSSPTPPLSLTPPHSLIPALGLLLGTGLGLAWGTRFLMDTLPRVIKNQLPDANLSWVMLGISLALAFAAFPAGILATRWGNQRVMLIGLAVTVAVLQLMVFVPSVATLVAAVIILILSFSLVVNGPIPLALSLVPSHRAGLGIGMYFGGFSAGMSLFGLFFSQPANISLVMNAILGAISFLVAGICIAASAKIPLAPNP